METVWNIFDQAWQWTGRQLVVAFGIVLASLVARRIVRFFLDRAAKRIAQRTVTQVDDLLLQAIEKPLEVTVVILGLFAAVFSLTPPPRIREWLESVFWIPFSLIIAWVMFRGVSVLSHILRRWTARTDTTLDDQLVPLIERAAKIVVWILAILMVLQNMGYSISGLIAGLGVGGLAVALAAQKTLSDVFGSIMLLVDRPFVLGDWVQSPDKEIEGIIERIGFRSTRIRTFEQTVVSIPNSRLADFVINNISQRPARRVWITVGVTYDTTVDQMREAVSRIDRLLRTHPEVDQKSTILVNFTDFGDSSLNIMVYYFANTIVWAEYLRIRETINLSIMEILEDLGLTIAFPTRTVYLHTPKPDHDGVETPASARSNK